MIVFMSTRSEKTIDLVNLKKKFKKSTIVIQENKGAFSLAELYNTILKKYPNEIILFIHDDINISTLNIEDQLEDIFNNTEYGIIGVAGSTSLPENGIWWQNATNMAGQVEHQTILNGKIKNYISKYSQKHDDIMQTIIIDGVFIAVDNRKNIVEFDESITGFHFYDVAFCLRNHLNGIKIGVTTNIEIKHKSVGKTTLDWEAKRKEFLIKYGNHLPQDINSIIPFSKNNKLVYPTDMFAVVILTKDKFELTSKCITSLLKYHNNIKIYIGDTGSSLEQQDLYKKFITDFNNINYIEIGTYNFAKNNNTIINEYVQEEIVVLCNNDIEFTSPILYKMYQYIKKDKAIGTIGCRLHYPNGRVQHGGIFIKKDNNNRIAVGHKGLYSWYGASTTDGLAEIGCTGALLMFTKKLFKLLGGLTETKECFEDVLFNLQAKVINKNNYYIGSEYAVHHESLTRKQNPDMLTNLNDDYINKLLPYIIKYHKKLKINV